MSVLAPLERLQTATTGHDAAAPAIYYLHPLLAGRLDAWARHFERAAGLGFDHVLIAPPFLPGRSGNIFLAADHRRLHPAVSRAAAAEGIAQAAAAARAQGLAPMLDLVIDQADAAHPLHVGAAYDDLPDARIPPAEIGRSKLPLDAAALDWWDARLREWADAGIAGFRADAAHRAPPEAWRHLIARARAHRPDLRFLAWTLGGAPAAIDALAGAGFDLVSTSSFAWDFRADWLTADMRRAESIALPLAMPERPFGPRLEAGQGERAIRFAAACAPAWLLPMGAEYGAPAALDPVRDRPELFDDLRARPRADLGAAIVDANAGRRARAHLPAARVISAPGAQAAALIRGNGAGAALILANAALDRAAAAPAAPILARAGAPVALRPDAIITLAPGELRILPAGEADPILLAQTGEAGAKTAAGRSRRIAIESLSPLVDGGQFPAKRIAGDVVKVEADILTDGHGHLAAVILWRPADEPEWREAPMRLLGNDRWAGEFPLPRLGRHLFAVEAWVDVFANLADELRKKHAAGADITLELEEARLLLARLARGDTSGALRNLARTAPEAWLDTLLAPETAAVVSAAAQRAFRTRSDLVPLDAERRGAAFASWYELFPRSQSGDPARHGTFDDVIARLPAVRAMGFDVLYFPPIHPIGAKNRKGRNNALKAGPDDPGSPYAIADHAAIHPELGTLDDFKRLIAAAASSGLEIALDFAVQCAPDHPWLREHPDWFSWRADGSIRYAENPPKRYEDIVNVDFYAAGAVPSLWLALRDNVLFWVDQGIKIFRVDNPHTKPFPFWEWMIADIRARHPDVLFLAEAFTRPKIMERLAKIGFTQSYTYFTWRHTAPEFREYITHLATPPVSEFFRPNFFVNTPDINPVFLQTSGRPGFLIRAALAATLSGLWGVYSGFELCEARALPGREEYLDSEKYEIRAWDWDRPGNLVAEITALNAIRRANPALQSHLGITFLPSSNDQILVFLKSTPSRDNTLLISIALDPHAIHETEVEFPLHQWNLPGDGALELEDLIGGGPVWTGARRRIRLDPAILPFAIWRVRTQDRE